jgi:hypothetical protein
MAPALAAGTCRRGCSMRKMHFTAARALCQKWGHLSWRPGSPRWEAEEPGPTSDLNAWQIEISIAPILAWRRAPPGGPTSAPLLTAQWGHPVPTTQRRSGAVAPLPANPDLQALMRFLKPRKTDRMVWDGPTPRIVWGRAESGPRCAKPLVWPHCPTSHNCPRNTQQRKDRPT